MLTIALSVGIYSYLILLLGLTGFLNYQYIFIVTFLFSFILLTILRKDIKDFLNLRLGIIFGNKRRFFLYLLLAILASVNLIGALGPELAFDALWYHLTIPKMYVLNNKIYFIHGNLLYYNLMPKLTEMLYLSALILGNEVVAKVIHFSFGLLSCFALYKLARIYLKANWSLFVVVAFYSNLVVSWLSITAYSDLARIFYEILAIYYFLLFIKKNKLSQLTLSAVLLGFAICVKILSIGSIFIFMILLFMQQKKISTKLKEIVFFTFVSLLIPLPWFVISYINSGNPFYPLFTHLGLRGFSLQLLSPLNFLITFVTSFLFSSDPISPIYLICIPLILKIAFRKFKEYKFLLVYSFISYIIWYATSQSGGARFLSAYLPVYTLLSVISIKFNNSKRLVRILVAVVILVTLTTILYRGIANKKYLPVIMGKQTKQDFLMKNLNFSFGDFYDENSEIKKIVGKSTVNLLNFHNLYYIDFPFTLIEFQEHKKFEYVLVQNSDIPNSYENAVLIYTNPRTHVKLYKLK